MAAALCCGLSLPHRFQRIGGTLRGLGCIERQRFFLTVMMTGLLVVVAPALSVARAVSV